MRNAVLLVLALAGCEDDRRASERPEPTVVVKREVHVDRAAPALPAAAAPRPELRLELRSDRVVITSGDPLPHVILRGDWTLEQLGTQLESVLRIFHADEFAGRTDVVLSVTSDVPYADLMAIMDHVTAAGFTDVQLSD